MGSSVLDRVDPIGKVGRFRPRLRRNPETFGQRNSRLGHIATRTSIGMVKAKMKLDEQRSKPTSMFNTQEGFGLNPDLLKTETTIFSKRAIERELTELE